MPKTTNPPGRHREQRLKMLAAKPQWLANDAPYGEYLVDTVALELFLRGAALSTYGEDEFVRRLHWWPGKLLLTRLFEDIQHIRSRIRRIEGLDPGEIRRFLKPISIRKVRDQDVIEPLWSSMRKLDGAIRDFLETYRPHNQGGNYDWLTRNFIDECFELWCRYVQVELYDEARVFNKLLAAAWRDVGFPTREQDGQRLEDRIADRVRKHFSDGVCSSRRDRQELTRLLDNERAGL